MRSGFASRIGRAETIPRALTSLTRQRKKQRVNAQPSGAASGFDKAGSNAAFTFENANRTAISMTGAWKSARGYEPKTNGKYYVEYTHFSTTNSFVGIATAGYNNGIYLGSDAESLGHYEGHGGFYHNGSSSYHTDGLTWTYSDGLVIRMAVNLDQKIIWIAVAAGSWSNSGDPSTNYGGCNFSGSSMAAKPIFFGISPFTLSAKVTVNTGQQPFTYSPPPGYVPWG